jgi:hypothetical protein
MKNRVIAAVAVVLISLPGCTDMPNSPLVPDEGSPTIGSPNDGRNSTDANTILFVLHDSTGESNGPADVQGMVMIFDKSIGQFAIYIVADSSEPFPAGQLFRININLFNPDRGTRARYPSFFSCTMNDYILPHSQTMMVLQGTDPAFACWREGNRVLTNSLRGTGNPEGVTLFRSAVGDALVGTSPSDRRTGFLDAEDTIADGPWAIAVRLQKSTIPGLSPATALGEPAVRQILRR